MAKRVRIGDILEIPTKKGLAYVQFSHEHKVPPYMGPIIRVLPGFFSERPKEFQALADQKELYYTLFHAPFAVKIGQFQLAGHAEVPAHARAFPIFRCGTIDPNTGKYYNNWWLWDGEKEWRVASLTDEQQDLSLREALNDIALIDNIEEGWTPRRSEELAQAHLKNAKAQEPLTPKGVKHVIIYRDRASADEGRALAEREQFEAEILDLGLDEKVQLFVIQGLPLSEEYKDHVAARLQEIAKQTRGTYDGSMTAF